MAKNKEAQAKEADAKATADKKSQQEIPVVDAKEVSGAVTEVVEQTLEEFEKGISEVKSAEELDAIEAREKEGKDRTGAYEIIEKRRNELQEEADKSKQKTASKKKTKKAKPGKKKVKILASNMAGKYLLSFGKGDEVELEEKQADEMIEAGDAKEV